MFEPQDKAGRIVDAAREFPAVFSRRKYSSAGVENTVPVVFAGDHLVTVS